MDQEQNNTTTEHQEPTADSAPAAMSTPAPAPMEFPHLEEVKTTSRMSYIVVAVIVVALLALAGLYVWGSGLQMGPSPEENLAPTTTDTMESATNTVSDQTMSADSGSMMSTDVPTSANDQGTAALKTQSKADDVSSIESDINATDLDSLDKESAEAEAALQ